VHAIAHSLSKCHRIWCTCAMRKDRHVPDIELVQNFFYNSCPFYDSTRCARRWLGCATYAPAIDTDEAQVERTRHLIVQRRHITDATKAEEHHDRSPGLSSYQKSV